MIVPQGIVYESAWLVFVSLRLCHAQDLSCKVRTCTDWQWCKLGYSVSFLWCPCSKHWPALCSVSPVSMKIHGDVWALQLQPLATRSEGGVGDFKITQLDAAWGRGAHTCMIMTGLAYPVNVYTISYTSNCYLLSFQLQKDIESNPYHSLVCNQECMQGYPLLLYVLVL